VVPSAAGDTAPLNTELDESATVPTWSGSLLAGSSSYQRSWARCPSVLRTVCWVQIASTFELSGSAWATAWVRRPSWLSSSAAVPGWRTLGGREKLGTATSVRAPVGAPVALSGKTLTVLPDSESAATT